MNELLKDVMMDACKKMNEEEYTDNLLYLTIVKMVEYTELLRKEGALALEERWNDNDYEKDIKRIYKYDGYASAPFLIPLGIQLIANGESEEVLTEILVAKYWSENPTGYHALQNYIVICAWKASYKEEYSSYAMQKLLTALLPGGREKGCESYKLKYFPHFIVKNNTPKEELMQRKYDFDESDGYIVTVKDKLEKRIKDAPDDILNKVIENVSAGWQLSVVIKYTSDEVRAKLFSHMSKEAAEEHSDRAVYTGDILFGDVMDALTFMLVNMIECEKGEV